MFIDLLIFLACLLVTIIACAKLNCCIEHIRERRKVEVDEAAADDRSDE
jgi:hypothetical protein